MKPDNGHLAGLLKEFTSILTAMENELGLPKERELRAALQKQMVALKESRNIIAVTGTMKAGKSTTLNTILGEELLPSRERAMTALPTLIRHNPKCNAPVLHLPAAREYYNMLQEMRETFRARALKADPATARILNELADFDLFLDVYAGDDIKRILSLINDLFREYANAGGAVPANLYRDSALFPHLEKSLEMFDRLGITDKDIWLMDTPGVNEAGQKEFGYGLEYYLAGVSGLILIIDYTQQNSEAFAELLKRVYDKNPELINQTLILLNKADNWSSKDDTLEESRQAIASQIFKNRIPLEKIFPVSAKYAFQGMMAKKRLLAGKTPAELGKDFWVLALGDMWEDIYPADDLERAIIHAEKLYARSAINEAINASFFESQAASRQKREEDILGQIYKAIAGLGAKLKEIQNKAGQNYQQKRDTAAKASQRQKHAQDTLARFSMIISDINDELCKTFVDLAIPPSELVKADIRRDYWYSTERSK